MSRQFTFQLVVTAPQEWTVGFYKQGGVYVEIAEAAAKRVVSGEPGRVLILAKRPDGTLIMQERAWVPEDDEEGSEVVSKKS